MLICAEDVETKKGGNAREEGGVCRPIFRVVSPLAPCGSDGLRVRGDEEQTGDTAQKLGGQGRSLAGAGGGAGGGRGSVYTTATGVFKEET